MHQTTKKKKRRLAILDSICEDEIVGILSRLPAKSLLRFKSVCKAWRTLIEETFFVQEHLEQSQQGGTNTRPNNIVFIDFNDGGLRLLDIESRVGVEVKLAIEVHCWNYLPRFSTMHLPHLLGACNGLVCIQTNDEGLGLLNPCTRTYAQLACIVEPPRNTAFGFGYDAKIKDYKLVRIDSFFAHRHHFFVTKVMVLRLGTNAWGRLPDIPYYVDSVPGKLVNGALHWIDYLTNQVICFDVEEEEFKVVSRAIYKTDGVLVQVAELGGCLALVCHQKRKKRDVEVWVMKEYGMEDSWTKMFSIASKGLPPQVSGACCFITALCILKNNEGIVLLIERDIVLYDLESSTYQHIHSTALAISGTVTFRGSLIIHAKNNSKASSRDLELQ